MLWCVIKNIFSSLCGCGFRIWCCLAPYCTLQWLDFWKLILFGALKLTSNFNTNFK